MELIADTSLLVGLWRKQAWAVDFAQANRQRFLGIPRKVLGEFWHVALKSDHDPEIACRFLLSGLPVHIFAPVVLVYARICYQAQKSGFYADIGQTDLWIAATALSLRLPLVTCNQRHFHRIDGMRPEIPVDNARR